MRRPVLIAAMLSCLGFCVAAQDVDLKLYSEFQRVLPDGEVWPADRAESPREILSPGLIRNAFTTFRIAVTGHPKATYFIAIQTNPDQIFEYRVYREAPGTTSDALTLEPKPGYFFGVLPESTETRVTQTYLLDIWTPADAPVQTVRFEVLIKRAYWTVIPMEVRILAPRVPALPAGTCCDFPIAIDHPADQVAWRAFFEGLAGGPQGTPQTPLTARAIVARNAMQDAALLRSLEGTPGTGLTDRIWTFLAARLSGAESAKERGAETYLDMRKAVWQAATKALPAPSNSNR